MQPVQVAEQEFAMVEECVREVQAMRAEPEMAMMACAVEEEECMDFDLLSTPKM